MAPTLIKSPPASSHLSAIEATLALTPLRAFGPSIFTNTRPLWHPPNARGIFGGAAIAQTLLAAYKTLPSPDFIIHSMHCYFVLAGDGDSPVIYYVEKVRDGKGFVTRTVQARQTGRVIFTTTMSFMRRGAGGPHQVRHHVGLPKGVGESPSDLLFIKQMTERERLEAESNGVPIGERSPFESWRLPIVHHVGDISSSVEEIPKSEKKTRCWIRARGRIGGSTTNTTPNPTSSPSFTSNSNNPVPTVDTAENGLPLSAHVPHACALAYMSDSYFIGTVGRVHHLTRWSNRDSVARVAKMLENEQGREQEKQKMEVYLNDIIEMEERENARGEELRRRKKQIRATQKHHPTSTAHVEDEEEDDDEEEKSIGMMVSLDHTIYFHNPEHFRADEWLFSEMTSPWAGDGRGLVTQHIWSREGVLVATCVQEGVLRLKQKEKEKGRAKL